MQRSAGGDSREDSRCRWLARIGILFHAIPQTDIETDWPLHLPPKVAVLLEDCPIIIVLQTPDSRPLGLQRHPRNPHPRPKVPAGPSVPFFLSCCPKSRTWTRTWCEVTRESWLTCLAAYPCFINTRPSTREIARISRLQCQPPRLHATCTLPAAPTRRWSLCFATRAVVLVLLALMVFDLEPCFIFLKSNAKRVTDWSTVGLMALSVALGASCIVMVA